MSTPDDRSRRPAHHDRSNETSPAEQANSVPIHAADTVPDEEHRLLFHELSAHQLALERQNDELRQLQGKLDRERARYFDLYHTAPVGYCTLSDNGLILEANQTAAAMLGVDRDVLINQPLARFIHQEDRDVFHVPPPGPNGGCVPQACELRLVRGDGAPFWVSLTTSTAAGADGHPQCRLVLCDISERKRTEQALKESEQRTIAANNLFKLVLDTIPVRLFWKDLTSTYLGCNRLFAQDAGFQVPEELIGLDDYCMGWKDQADMYRQDDFAIMISGKPKLHYEEAQTTPDGKRIWLSTSKTPLRDEQDRIIGILGAYEDITERKWAEQELLKAQKLESLQFLANSVAHDFNNILMAVMGHIAFAKTLLSPEDEASRRLTKAEATALRAREVTRQLLAFAQNGPPTKHPVTVAHLLSGCSRFTLGETQSTCTCALGDDLWSIDADEGQIGQALTNLLMHADRAMPGGGPIRIRCDNTMVAAGDPLPLARGKYVALSITYQGVKGESDNREHLFAPSSRESLHELGVAAAQAIVKNHGGHLSMTPAPEGGIVFTLLLPAALSPASAPVAPPEEKTELIQGSGTILVMDDDEVICSILGTMLASLGYQATFAQDGEQAVEQYALALQSGQPFDAVIMDLIVPCGMGGREAMARIRAMDPQAKGIVSSGYSNSSVMADYASYGFSEVMAKPYRFSELSRKLRQLLGDRPPAAAPAPPDEQTASS